MSKENKESKRIFIDGDMILKKWTFYKNISRDEMVTSIIALKLLACVDYETDLDDLDAKTNQVVDDTVKRLLNGMYGSKKR